MSARAGQAKPPDPHPSTEPYPSKDIRSQLDETILTMVIAQHLLPEILSVLCTAIEKRHSGLLCSVLLLDADGVTLHNAAAPSLPQAYCQAIEGVRIGPSVGSCGTAAYRKTQVVVSDIATDSLWADYRGLALEHGLRACWSTPILSQDSAVAGPSRSTIASRGRRMRSTWRSFRMPRIWPALPSSMTGRKRSFA